MIHVCQLRFCCCVASRWGAKPMESYGLRHQLIRHWQFLGKTLPGWKTVPTFWRCQLLSGSVAPNLHPPLKNMASLLLSWTLQISMPCFSCPYCCLQLAESPAMWGFLSPHAACPWAISDLGFGGDRCDECVQMWCWFHPQIPCISRPRLPLEAPPELGSDDLPGWRIVCRSAAFIADPLPTGDLVAVVYGWFTLW